MTNEELQQIIYGLINGSIYLIIVTFLRLYWDKKVLNKINMIFKDEEILHVFEPTFDIAFLWIFCLGGFWGSFIFPFFISDSLQNISIVTRSSLPLFIVLELLICTVMIFIFSITNIVTSRRVYRLSYFSFVNKIIIGLNVLISDISSVEHNKFLFFDQLSIKTHEQTYNLSGFKNLKGIEKLLNNLRIGVSNLR